MTPQATAHPASPAPVADVIDVFGERWTPRFCQARPALAAARLAWGLARRRAEATAHAEYVPADPRLQAGQRVTVELAPRIFGRGEILRWTADPLPGAAYAIPLAHVRLDPWPPGIVPPADFAAGEVVARSRRNLAPLPRPIASHLDWTSPA
jgi:hypothetical protein